VELGIGIKALKEKAYPFFLLQEQEYLIGNIERFLGSLNEKSIKKKIKKKIVRISSLSNLNIRIVDINRIQRVRSTYFFLFFYF